MFRQLILVFDVAMTVVSAVGHVQSTKQTQQPPLKEVATFESQRPTGVAVSKDARMFVNFPRWEDQHQYSVVEVMRDGTLKPYPDQQWNSWKSGSTVSPSKSWVCVQSVWIDDQDNLWVLDAASPKLEGVVSDGPKLVRINLETNKPDHIVTFDDEIAPSQSYLNDVRVDTKRKWAYITDSGLGAIIAVNLENGQARRFLEDHSSTKAEDGVTITVKDKPVRDENGRTPQVHADGIALSRNGEHLYYHALTGKTLYRIATEALRVDSQSGQTIAQEVERLGETGVCDGMFIDNAGNIYHTALEEDAIVRFTPDKSLEIVVQDERINWPDSLAMRNDNQLYFTTSQLQNMRRFGGTGTNEEPFRVFMIERPAHGGEKPLH